MKAIEISNEYVTVKGNFIGIKKAMLDDGSFSKDDFIEAKIAFFEKDRFQENDRFIFFLFPLGQFASPQDFQTNILNMNLNIIGMEISLRLFSKKENKKVNLFYN